MRGKTKYFQDALFFSTFFSVQGCFVHTYFVEESRVAARYDDVNRYRDLKCVS